MLYVPPDLSCQISLLRQTISHFPPLAGNYGFQKGHMMSLPLQAEARDIAAYNDVEEMVLTYIAFADLTVAQYANCDGAASA